MVDSRPKSRVCRKLKFEKMNMTSWESAVIKETSLLKDAILSMNNSGLRIVLVSDANNRLQGVITDGDLRRALMRNFTLETSVKHVMCNTPKVAKSNWSRERLQKFMEDFDLYQLPVVDDDGFLVGLQTLHGIVNKTVLNNPVFIMAGGFGTRLHPLTDDCPKPMLRVGDKPILELILDSLIKAGFHRFYISTHYLPHVVRDYFGNGDDWGVSIKYTHEVTPLGTAGALSLLPKSEINDSLLLMNGDLLTSLDYRGLIDFHKNKQSVATMCVRDFEYKVPYGVVNVDGYSVQSIVEKPTQKYYINAGIYVLSPSLVKSVPENTKIDMPTLLTNSIATKGMVTVYPMHEHWLDIGRMEDFNAAGSMLAKM